MEEGREKSGRDAFAFCKTHLSCLQITNMTTNTPPKTLSHKDCHFQAHKTPILSSHQLDTLSDGLHTSTIPEMIFHSELKLKMDSNDPQKSPSLTIAFRAPDALFYALKSTQTACNSLITPVKVQHAWDKSVIHDRILNEDKEIEERDDDMDWTFSTCYKGTLERGSPEDSQNHPPVRVFREPKRGINYEHLSQKEEILFYDDIILFEDELHDAGMCMLSVKIRVMPTCYFILLRYFLRVDNVMVRMMDTRYYHVFGENEIIREFSHRENTLEQLKKKNPFLLRDPKFLDSPDRLQQFMDLKEKYNEMMYIDESKIPSSQLKHEVLGIPSISEELSKQDFEENGSEVESEG